MTPAGPARQSSATHTACAAPATRYPAARRTSAATSGRRLGTERPITGRYARTAATTIAAGSSVSMGRSPVRSSAAARLNAPSSQHGRDQRITPASARVTTAAVTVARAVRPPTPITPASIRSGPSQRRGRHPDQRAPEPGGAREPAGHQARGGRPAGRAGDRDTQAGQCLCGAPAEHQGGDRDQPADPAERAGRGGRDAERAEIERAAQERGGQVGTGGRRAAQALPLGPAVPQVGQHGDAEALQRHAVAGPGRVVVDAEHSHLDDHVIGVDQVVRGQPVDEFGDRSRRVLGHHVPGHHVCVRR